jgi:hypothetical protein
MKSGTIINKIITQIDAHAEIMKNLLSELDDSLEKENNKLKEDIAKKIATSFDLDFEQVLKKVIKRKKKNSDLFEQIEDINSDSIELENEKDYIPVYKKIIFEDKEYYYDDKPNGYVFKTNEGEINIVGYIDFETKTINFM